MTSTPTRKHSAVTHSLSLSVLPLYQSLHNMKPLLALFYLLTVTTTTATVSQTSNDAVSLLSFKSKADLDNKLLFTLHERFDYCQWQGIKCSSTGRVIRLVLPNSGLRGTIFLSSLTNLGQLRVLSLRNNSLYGPLPDFSSLPNLKSLFLSRNYFSGSFPVSVLGLHRLTVLDLSVNRFEGFIPANLSSLDRLTTLLLQSNRFNGTLPPLNLPLLLRFNVSGNKLSGNVPATPTLSRFDSSAFSLNPELCGELINKACKSSSPFFDSPSSNATSPNAPLGQQAMSTKGGGDTGGGVVTQPRKHKRSVVIVGFAVGVSVLIASILCIFAVGVCNNYGRKETSSLIDKQKHPESQGAAAEDDEVRGGEIINANAKSQEATDVDYQQVKRSAKSGSLVFCRGSGELHIYTLEQLMRASAELLGRGTIGTTYKALLDNQLIVTVKRVDATKTAIISSEAFERHMDTVGALRHPNLVPIMAYFQAKGERLVIYEYQPNGSLFNLIHGSRSTRAKPLHWTSCLKIAEDVAQGLAYIHQSSKLVHGNLKSTNVLLGADFEACITDYSLANLLDASSEDPDSTACKAPEARRSNLRATAKSDVFTFGVLLLELLTGKHPSQHPYLVPADMFDWVRAVRDDDNGDDNQLGMLVEVSSLCSLTSPEQRPSMCQVLSMIQEIKESVIIENNAGPGH